MPAYSRVTCMTSPEDKIYTQNTKIKLAGTHTHTNKICIQKQQNMYNIH